MMDLIGGIISGGVAIVIWELAKWWVRRHP